MKSETSKKESEELHRSFWKSWEKHREKSQKEIRKLIEELPKLSKKQNK